MLLLLVRELPLSRGESKCNKDVLLLLAKLMLYVCRRLLPLADRLLRLVPAMLLMRLARQKSLLEELATGITECELLTSDVMLSTCRIS